MSEFDRRQILSAFASSYCCMKANGSGAASSSNGPPDGFRVIFNEDFDCLSLRTGGPTDSGLSAGSGRWTPRYPFSDDPKGFSLINNLEEQFNVDPSFNWPEPYHKLGQFSIGNSILKIRAEKTPEIIKNLVPIDPNNGLHYRWVSGVLTSRHHALFGSPAYFEVRAKVPSGKAVWAAFWSLGYDWSKHREIDFFEFIGTRPTYLSYATHVVLDDGTWRNNGLWAELNKGDISREFHVYGCLREREKISFFFDGTLMYACPTDVLFSEVQMFLIIGLTVGGRWPGAVEDSVNSPVDLLIDYIRVYGTDRTTYSIGNEVFGKY